MTIQCSNCSHPFAETYDEPDGRRNPCPNCGGLEGIYIPTIGESCFSNYSLDTFIAYRLSELTACSAPAIESDANWLNTFILSCAFRFQLPPKTRAYIFNFIRRVEGATSAYRMAVESIEKYLITPQNVFSPYFQALSHIEICISQCYQALELLSRASGEPIFAPGEGSREESLHIVYIDSKHMDRMIHGDKLPGEAPSGVWLTNDGVASARGSLSFVDLNALLTNIHSLAEKLAALDVGTGENQ